MNPLNSSSRTASNNTSNLNHPNLDDSHPGVPRELAAVGRTFNAIEQQHFYQDGSTSARLVQSDPRQFNTEPNFMNVGRFFEGSSSRAAFRDHAYCDHGATSHSDLSYRFSTGPRGTSMMFAEPGGHRQPISDISRASWDNPFLDQVDRAAIYPGYQWIDPLNHVTPKSDRPLGHNSFVSPSYKSPSKSSQIMQPTPVPPLDIARPQPIHPIMAIQTKPVSIQPNHAPVSSTPAAVVATLADNGPNQEHDQDSFKSRKKHGCSMCHKSFDRPSTLRKHLLVHTGEKAFVCDICGRRFGVNSNLNRHVKRCILRNPGDGEAVSASPESPARGEQTTTAPVAGPSNTSASDPPHSPAPAVRKRKATSSRALASSPTQTRGQILQAQAQPPPKRRRRPTSPVQWVPESLADFNLFSIEGTKSTCVPLPPVSPLRDPNSHVVIEERNSWDENTSSTPYHPSGWKGFLPGPGLGRRDIGNLTSSPPNGGYVMGRLVLS